MATRPKHIVELDSLRGIAAIAVFFHHLSFASIDQASTSWGPVISSICKLSRYGLYGVDLFFVLSGYLITTILLEDRSSANYYFNFYWKRALRILPLYLISLFVAWVWFRASVGGVIVSVLFLANFGRLLHVDIGGPFWTLAIEEQFYLVWPQFVRRLRVNQLKQVAFAIVIAELALRLLDTAFHHYDFQLTFFRCDGLALGALLACQLYHDGWNISATPVRRRKMTAVWILLCSCIFLAFTKELMSSSKYMMQGSALFLSAINLCFYCCIRIAVENSGAKFLAVFRSAVLVFFGEISYCMYMSHTYVMRLYDDWRGPLVPGRAFEYWARIAIVFCATIVVCVISRYALEIPFMSLRKYVLRRAEQPVYAPQSVES